MTDIEWTNAPGFKGETWNPVRGCTKISPGCKHCYAETFAERWRGIPGHAYERGFELREVPAVLDAPLRWTKPRMVFVNSMSDLLHEGIGDEYIDQVVATIAATPHHVYQLLTKRAERLPEYFGRLAASQPHDEVNARVFDLANVLHGGFAQLPLPNLWVGVSVEDRKHGVPRIDHLRQVPAVVRFLSIEPLLEDLGTIDLTGIHWVIVGGESGAGARPFLIDWARSIRDQCRAASVPFFFKQTGPRPLVQHPMEPGALLPVQMLARKGNDPAEWPEDLRVREWPEVLAA